jgi:hypothetical protein
MQGLESPWGRGVSSKMETVRQSGKSRAKGKVQKAKGKSEKPYAPISLL